MRVPSTRRGRQHASDLRLIFKGVPLIIGKPEEIVADIERDARNELLDELYESGDITFTTCRVWKQA